MTRVQWLCWRKLIGKKEDLLPDQCHDRSGQPDKRSDKKLGQKSSKRQFSDARQLGCVFQDMKPPKSILQKGTDMRKPIQRVTFTKAIARHTKIRDQNPSLGYICPNEPHERSPNAPKFEDRLSVGDRVARARCPRSSVEDGQKCVKRKGASESNILLTFRKTCACLHQILILRSENLLSTPVRQCIRSAKRTSVMLKMDTLTKSCSPTIVITVNGEVQTHEEATVYVKELDKLLTLKILENTPAVLSLGKLCDENGYSYEWIHGQKPHLIKNGIRKLRNTENFVPTVVPGLSSSSSGSSSTSNTPSRQESHSSSSSSASSSSPTVSEIQIREREDGSNSGIFPVPSVNFGWWSIRATRWNHDRIWDPGVAARLQGKFGGWWNSSTWRLSRQFFLRRFFRAHIQETWGFG